MEIKNYRTVAVMYPHLSLEVEVADGDKKYYVNMDVNNKRKEEVILEDSWWSYDRPLDEVDCDNYDDCLVSDVDFNEILNQMVNFWNENPEFEHDTTWKKWSC